MPAIQFVFDGVDFEVLLKAPDTSLKQLTVNNGGILLLNGASIETAMTLNNFAGTLSVAKGGTGQTSSSGSFNALSPMTVDGDLITRAAGTAARLGIGTAGQVLTVVAGAPAWVAAGGSSPLTTKGDLFTFSTVNARLPVGTNGQMLTADSSQTTGLRWNDREYAAMTITGNATATPIASQSVAIEIAGVSAAGLLKGFSHTADPARLTKTSADTKVYEVQMSVTTVGVTNSNVLGYMIAKNGAVILTTRQTNTVNGASNRMATSLVALVSLAQNDYIQLFAINDTSASDLTVQQMSCTIEEAGV